jgi:GntR family transcriptional regulator, transcriptional repressor for pyruvate dehydrogenase complex
MFQTAKPTKVFQDVVTQIEEAILAGRIQTGETLPSERELKEMFQISRGTLREALRVLEQKGLIEIRLGVGGGSVVKSVDGGRVTESLGLLIRSQKVSLQHLAEFREALEGSIAAQAAERRTAADVRKLKDLLDHARACLHTDRRRDEFLDVDRQLHTTIAATTQNPIYQSVLDSIHDNIHRYYDRFLSMDDRELQENYRDLCNIVESIETGNANEARRLAREHVHRFNAYMQHRATLEESAGSDFSPGRIGTPAPLKSESRKKRGS